MQIKATLRQGQNGTNHYARGMDDAARPRTARAFARTQNPTIEKGGSYAVQTAG